jgi:hypothetical protein
MQDGSIIFKCSRRHSIEGTSRDEARVWRVEGLISLHLPSASFLPPPLFSSCSTSNILSFFYGSHGARRGAVALRGQGRGRAQAQARWRRPGSGGQWVQTHWVLTNHTHTHQIKFYPHPYPHPLAGTKTHPYPYPHGYLYPTGNPHPMSTHYES